MGCFVKLQRPGFTEMMDAVESGAVKTVVTKDLSRLGRNYLQVGLFTEITFPKKGVRFIAINDGVDSAQGDNDMSALRNLFNEWMVRDTSKKIKAVFRAKGMSGKPITSQPVYGYLKGPDGHFVVDPEAAPVVRVFILPHRKRGLKSARNKAFSPPKCTRCGVTI